MIPSCFHKIRNLVFILFFCSSPDASALEHSLYGVPNCSGKVLHRTGYDLCYDIETKNATWTSYCLKDSFLSNLKVKRKDDFRPDPDLKKGERAELQDYLNSGYDRGHLVPAGDMSRSEVTMSESFLLSNMAPQIGPYFNRGIWKDLEAKVRKWAKLKRNIYVFTGPLYLEGNAKCIGANRIVVPSHFYKIIVHINRSEVSTIAFILPNKANPTSKLASFIVSIDDIEKKSGIDFLEELNDSIENKIESGKAQAMWPER